MGYLPGNMDEHCMGSSFQTQHFSPKAQPEGRPFGPAQTRRGESCGLEKRVMVSNRLLPGFPLVFALWGAPPTLVQQGPVPAFSSHSPENRCLGAGSRPPVFRLQPPRATGPQRGWACGPGGGRPGQRCDFVVGSFAFLDSWLS